jgi:hypothetical protein
MKHTNCNVKGLANSRNESTIVTALRHVVTEIKHQTTQNQIRRVWYRWYVNRYLIPHRYLKFITPYVQRELLHRRDDFSFMPSAVCNKKR